MKASTNLLILGTKYQLAYYTARRIVTSYFIWLWGFQQFFIQNKLCKYCIVKQGKNNQKYKSGLKPRRNVGGNSR